MKKIEFTSEDGTTSSFYAYPVYKDARPTFRDRGNMVWEGILVGSIKFYYKLNDINNKYIYFLDSESKLFRINANDAFSSLTHAVSTRFE